MRSPSLLHALLLLALVGFSVPGEARQDPGAVRSEVMRFLRTQTVSLPGEVNIQVGEFAPDNVLPPCVQLEAFLPPGARASGASRIAAMAGGVSTWQHSTLKLARFSAAATSSEQM